MKKNVDDFGLDQKDDTNYGTIFEVKFNESGNTYTVLEDGTILTEEEVENNDKLPKLLKENNIVLEVGETKTIEVIENDNIESVDWKNYDENIVTMVKDTTSNNKKINISPSINFLLFFAIFSIYLSNLGLIYFISIIDKMLQ